MTYNGYVLTLVDGFWFAWDRGTLIASGSKSYVFSVIDSL